MEYAHEAAARSHRLPEVDLTALDPGEHDQIDYWKPAAVGELLFNFWD
ncbi:hypothetical protein ACLQ25_31525 [Micromonospora sp. DT44]